MIRSANNDMPDHHVVVIMGVSGSGKSAVARAVASVPDAAGRARETRASVSSI